MTASALFIPTDSNLRTVKASRRFHRLALGSISLLAALIGEAGVLGRDDRVVPEALLDARETQLYSATQIIVCSGTQGDTHAAGNVAGDLTHGVTVAHIFWDRDVGHERRGDACRFRVHDRNGRKIDEVAITRFVTFWRDGPPWLGHDLAMFELARPPKSVVRPLAIATSNISVGQELLVVAFHFDVTPAFTKRKTRGRVFSTLGTPDEQVANIFHTDADVVPMSSGGIFYDANGAAVAMAQGESAAPRAFDAKRDLNRAIRFDPRFLAEFDDFVAGRR